MKISTRGRYALRVMQDLAEHNDGAYVPLKDIAERQEISLKYLEAIAKELAASSLILAQHGKGGGYKLYRSTEDYTVYEILSIVEKDMAPVACLEKNAPPCPRASNCKTLLVWKGLYDVVFNYLNNITLSDLINTKTSPDWVI